MQRWGQLHPATDIDATTYAVYRPGLYREVAASLGLAAPAEDIKDEGRHADCWSLDAGESALALGPDRFFDGGGFDALRAARRTWQPVAGTTRRNSPNHASVQE